VRCRFAPLHDKLVFVEDAFTGALTSWQVCQGNLGSGYIRMSHSEKCWAELSLLLAEAQSFANDINLPHLAAQSDLADPQPMCDQEGRPYAETTFSWIDADAVYWRDRKLALSEPFMTAVRLVGEPIYYADGGLHLGRTSKLLDAIDCSQARASAYLGEAIITPVHLPRGLVGAMLWCSKTEVGVADIFAEHAPRLHFLATRIVACHNEARGRPRNAVVPQRLTRREAQCLRWAAAGKTDGEIGTILDLSVSTVRFHLRNAASKLGASGRTQSIQLAAGLGFIGGV
jgi:DNA-binding CsgD family transcriptional regulator